MGDVKRHDGLTLIEAVVVIAVIVGFAVILVWLSLCPQSDSVLAIQCMSNMKRIYVAMIEYAYDYDDYICPVAMGEPEESWVEILKPSVEPYGRFYQSKEM